MEVLPMASSAVGLAEIGLGTEDAPDYVVRIPNAYGDDHYFGYESAMAARVQVALEPQAELVRQPGVVGDE